MGNSVFCLCRAFLGGIPGIAAYFFGLVPSFARNVFGRLPGVVCGFFSLVPVAFLIGMQIIFGHFKFSF